MRKWAISGVGLFLLGGVCGCGSTGLDGHFNADFRGAQSHPARLG
jgi:hypothetical protein